ncbi:MAG: ornithine carbamoyltransferase [Anaerolineae bacterium]|nr:ornithine carbamoyltransferase [Anaerolineae bacterium]NUQ04384.1 ornithine carbamoyltransferase [Anaerolineae bacterium]
MQHFIDLDDWSDDSIRDLLTLASRLKAEQKQGGTAPLLQGKHLALIFEKPSLRTRVSFEVGMSQLGGTALRIGPDEIGMGARESIPDIARAMSRYVDGIMARVFGHEKVVELAQWATVPVINGLSATHHPCQALADAMTIMEHCGAVQGRRVVFVGDANNVARSLGQAVIKLGAHFVVASPPGYGFDEEVLTCLDGDAKASGGSLEVLYDPFEAVRGADVIYTDTWVSMGQEAEAAQRIKAFDGYQVNADLLAKAGGTPKVMHCLPAHRGQEITDEAADGANSVIFDQAENRLHAQKAILVRLLG